MQTRTSGSWKPRGPWATFWETFQNEKAMSWESEELDPYSGPSIYA